MTHARWPIELIALIALALIGCADLADIDADGRCGNGIIEPASNEDCEPGLTLPPGLACGELSDEARCRFVCKDTACPSGWGCSLEDICSAPAGTFDRRRTLSGLAGTLSIGDFDGDDLPDLVNVAEPVMTVAFGDIDGEFDTLVSVPIDSAPSPPVIGDLEPLGESGDDESRLTDDIVVFAGRRVNIYRGRTDQELEPVAVPAGQLTDAGETRAVVAMRAGEPIGRQLAVVIGAEAGQIRFVVPDGAANAPLATVDVSGELGGEPEDGARLPARLAVADLDAADPTSDRSAIRDELGWAVIGGDTVRVAGLDCIWGDTPEIAPRCTLTERAAVAVPAGWAIGSDGVFFGDVDGDAVPDLIVGLLDDRGTVGLGVARGERDIDGFAGFAALAAAPAPAGPAPMGSEAAPGMLAVADLGGGVAELIFATGSYTVTAGPGPLMPAPGTFRQPGRPLDDLIAVDFNADGRIDLLTRSAQSLVLYLNVGGASFNGLEATVADPFDWMGVGDFDGDLLTDIVVASSAGISIGFNPGAGPPTRFVPVLDARAPLIALAVVRLPDGNFDSIDDVVAVAQAPGGGSMLLALRGSGVGRLTAPFNAPENIRGMAVLKRRSANEQGLVAALAVIGAMEMGHWSFLGLDWGDLAQGTDLEPQPVGFDDADCIIDDVDLLFAPVDVDGDGDDELIAFETAAPGDPSDTAMWRPRLLRFDGLTGACALLDPATTAEPAQSVHIADLDGDGRFDLLAALRSTTQDGDAPAGVARLAIWWGNGDGFEPKPVECQPTGLAGGFGGALAVTELDSTPGAELVLNGAVELYRVDIDPTRAAVCGETRSLGIQNIDANSIAGLHATDINADGLLDLILSSTERVQVVTQTPCTAQRQAEGACSRAVISPRAVSAP